ncbi:hypothetical protein WN944_025536 [Citrus x changshan-huyou]|uniref:Uncharacterized protein n=1 Tax=Citrus x changshan-huyou TaxID=2935761 RepID=A0AAP0QGR9_9ROSI
MRPPGGWVPLAPYPRPTGFLGCFFDGMYSWCAQRFMLLLVASRVRDSRLLSRFQPGLPVPRAQQLLLQPLLAHLDPLVLCLFVGPNPPLDGPPAPSGPPDRPPHLAPAP